MEEFIYIVQILFGQLVLFGIYKLLLCKLTFFRLNRFYLSICLILPIVLPFFSLPWLSESLLGEESRITLETIEVGLTAIEKKGSQFFDLGLFSKGIYFIGLSMASFLLFMRLYGLYQLIRKSPTKRIDKIYWIETQEVEIASFFHFLFIPPNFKNQTSHRIILDHEKVHIEQKHSIDVLMVSFFQIVLWFNPLIYWIKKAMLLNHEYLADAAVMKKHSKKTYIRTIIENTGTFQLQLANSFNYSPIKSRIMMLQKENSTHFSYFRYLSFGLAVIGILFVFSCKKEKAVNAASATKTELKSETSSLEEIYSEVDVMPEFPGGKEQLLRFIYTNVKYPKQARDKGAEGMVVLSFVIGEDGQAKDFEVLRPVEESLSEEALRVVKEMPKWKPGTLAGKIVPVKYTLPVKFKLEK